MAKKANSSNVTASAALKFVVLLGVVNLFADLTYEGARSVVGPYLGILGASATAVGIVAGLGELIGYAFRLVSGYLSDRTGRYWAITILGYSLNLLAVPLLALAGRWEVAAGLIVLERIGKALRTPARDAMLSHATSSMGRGWGFGLHEAFDQVGAVLGPLVVAAVLYFGGGYRTGFAILLVPALVALAVLVAARLLYPRPQDLEMEVSALQIKGLSRLFWLYLAGVGLIAAGFADFPLIAFHFGRVEVVPEVWIPTFYAVAMGVDAISALVFGRLTIVWDFGCSCWRRSCRRCLLLLSSWVTFMGRLLAWCSGALVWARRSRSCGQQWRAWQPGSAAAQLMGSSTPVMVWPGSWGAPLWEYCTTCRFRHLLSSRSVFSCCLCPS